ncbi:MAG TPA: hypothetical protein VND22_03440 [Actinomycetota bacterium]|nr:hypothetical protein [Actinomycetota bacterium]
MTGAGAAFSLAAIQMLGGTAAFLSVTFLVYSSIGRGYYRSALWVLAPLIAASAFLMEDRARVSTIVAAACMSGFLLAVYTQRPLLEWAGAALTLGTSAAAVIVAAQSFCEEACESQMIQAIAGLLFLGAVTHAMTLGHWYLNQPRLPIGPISHATWVMLGATVVALGAGIIGRAGLIAGDVPQSVLTRSPGAYWWFWLVMVAMTLVLWWMVKETVASRSTQSATGLLYIAIVTAVSAQLVSNILAVM